MCEINPKHTLIFRLEAYTSDPNMSRELFEQQVMDRLLKAEMALNADGRFRFHIHDDEARRAPKLGSIEDQIKDAGR